MRFGISTFTNYSLLYFRVFPRIRDQHETEYSMSEIRKQASHSTLKQIESIAPTTPSQPSDDSTNELSNHKVMNQMPQPTDSSIRRALRKKSQPKLKSEDKNSKSKKIRGKRLELNKEHLKNNLIFWDIDSESRVMPYKILRTKIYQKFNQNDWNSVGITSPNPEEGKSVTAINLAFTFTRSIKNHVLLVDLDFHRPSIHKKLGFSPRFGLIDYLNGDAPISKILYGIPNSNCIVIPGREAKDLPLSLMNSDRVKRFHNLINRLFPSCYIFYDMPPVLAVDDAIIFKEKDCNLIVASENSTSVNDLNQTMELLGDQNIIGYALNKSRNRSRIVKNGYYYYGEYGGYEGYSKYTKKA